MRESADLLDANVWLALVAEAHVHHERALRYWTSEAASTIAFCRVTHTTLLRLLTNKSVMGVHALSPARAWATVELLLARPEIELFAEPHGVEDVWQRFVTRQGASAGVWTDAYLAAFAVSSNSRFVTFDKGFKSFSGLSALVLS